MINYASIDIEKRIVKIISELLQLKNYLIYNTLGALTLAFNVQFEGLEARQLGSIHSFCAANDAEEK